MKTHKARLAEVKEAIGLFLSGRRADIEDNGGDYYMDDHIIGIDFVLNGAKICLPWCGPEIYAAVRYAHCSEEAMRELEDFIRAQVAGDDAYEYFSGCSKGEYRS